MFYGALRMPEHTSTLRVGDAAPEFELEAANRPGKFSLAHDALRRGAAGVLEFLRGTW